MREPRVVEAAGVMVVAASEPVLTVAGGSGKRFQIKERVAGNDGETNSIPVSTRHQRLENLLGRQAHFGGHGFRRKIVRVHLILAQFVPNAELIENTNGVGLGRHAGYLLDGRRPPAARQIAVDDGAGGGGHRQNGQAKRSVAE